jgi:hypothetical protein
MTRFLAPLKSIIGVALTGYLITAPVLAQHYLATGEGVASCATWLSSPNKKVMGNVWIMGYFTGRNVERTSDRDVGKSTDADGSVGEVELICKATPSAKLGEAASTVFEAMARPGQLKYDTK